MTLSPESPHTALPDIDTSHPEEFVEQLSRLTESLPARINIDPESVEQGLAKLVLTLIEFIRRLLEKQAVRRMEGGDLSPEQIEHNPYRSDHCLQFMIESLEDLEKDINYLAFTKKSNCVWKSEAIAFLL